MKKRFLNILDWSTIVNNFNTVQTFMNGSASVMTDLQTRMSSAESGRTALETRMSTAESKITGLETRFTTGRATAIAAISATPSGGVIDLLGVQVATGAAISNLVNFCVSLRDSHNALIAASKSWGWMKT